MIRNGFSLLELVISQATLMVVILAFAGLWAMSQQGVASAHLSSDLALKMQEVREALKRQASCGANLADVDLSLTNPNGTSVRRLAFFTSGALEREILSMDQVIDGHQVLEMRLRPVAQVDTAQISSVLEITFQRSGMLGPTSARRSVGVLSQVRQGKVQACRLLQDGNLSAGKQICLALSDGALDVYDPLADECTLLNGSWIAGATPYSASCPAGFTLPEKAGAGFNCSIIEPTGFVDPSPTVPGTLSDGSTAYVDAPPPYRTKLINRSCECAYDIDIPESVRNQFQCRILCAEL